MGGQKQRDAETKEMKPAQNGRNRGCLLAPKNKDRKWKNNGRRLFSAAIISAHIFADNKINACKRKRIGKNIISGRKIISIGAGSRSGPKIKAAII